MCVTDSLSKAFNQLCNSASPQMLIIDKPVAKAMITGQHLVIYIIVAQTKYITNAK